MTILRTHLHNYCVKTTPHTAGSVSGLVSRSTSEETSCLFIVEVFIFKMDQERFSGKELLGYTGSHSRRQCSSSHRRKDFKASTVAALPTLRHCHNQTRTVMAGEACVPRVEVLTSLHSNEKRTPYLPSPRIAV
jgi:hypothetical protein